MSANIGALAIAQTPPLSVPGRFFLTAPLFAVAAALWAAWIGPGLLGNRWSQELIAVTHLYTLGFLAMAMLGALQQLLPVLLGARLPRPRLFSAFLHLALTGGTAALAAGIAGGGPWTGLAILLLGGALFLAVPVLLWRLFTASAPAATRLSMAAAVAALMVAGSLGLHLAAGWVAGGGSVARVWTDTHMAWGLIGWVALLVAGVGYQVVPMFQITPDYPPLLTRWLGPGVLLGLLLWSAGGPFAGVGGALLATALVLFAMTTLSLQRRRRRRLPDVTLGFWRTAMASLLLAVGCWLLVRVGVALPTPLPVLLFVLGFGTSVVAGMLYKIVPFLVWLHLNNRAQARGPAQGGIPTMRQVIAERHARRHLRLHRLALVVAAAAPFSPEWLLRPAALLLALAFSYLAVNIAGAFRLFRKLTREMACVDTGMATDR